MSSIELRFTWTKWKAKNAKEIKETKDATPSPESLEFRIKGAPVVPFGRSYSRNT